METLREAEVFLRQVRQKKEGIQIDGERGTKTPLFHLSVSSHIMHILARVGAQKVC